MASVEKSAWDKVAKLCERKLALLQDIMALSRGIIFRAANEAELYIAMVDKRKPLFDEITALDAEIFSTEADTPAAAGVAPEPVLKLKQAIRELAADILAADAEMSPEVVRVMSELRAKVKDLRQSKSVMNIYQSADMFRYGGKYDNKN